MIGQHLSNITNESATILFSKFFSEVNKATHFRNCSSRKNKRAAPCSTFCTAVNTAACVSKQQLPNGTGAGAPTPVPVGPSAAQAHLIRATCPSLPRSADHRRQRGSDPDPPPPSPSASFPTRPHQSPVPDPRRFNGPISRPIAFQNLPFPK